MAYYVISFIWFKPLNVVLIAVKPHYNLILQYLFTLGSDPPCYIVRKAAFNSRLKQAVELDGAGSCSVPIVFLSVDSS